MFIISLKKQMRYGSWEYTVEYNNLDTNFKTVLCKPGDTAMKSTNHYRSSIAIFITLVVPNTSN